MAKIYLLSSSTISNHVKCSVVGCRSSGQCNKVPAAAGEKPRGDVCNWTHCADEEESELGAELPVNSSVTADRLRCGAPVCRRNVELFCNTSVVRQH